MTGKHASTWNSHLSSCTHKRFLHALGTCSCQPSCYFQVADIRSAMYVTGRERIIELMHVAQVGNLARQPAMLLRTLQSRLGSIPGHS